MKLTEIENRLRVIGNPRAKLPGFGANNTIQNLRAFRELVQAVRGIPGFEPLTSVLDQTPLLATRQDSLQVGPDVWQQVSAAVSELGTAVLFLQRFLPEIGIVAPSPEQIYVRLERTEQFSEAVSQMETLKTALEQTILDPKVGGKLELKSVENGSVWLILSVGSAAAVGFVGGLAWAAAVVYKKIQEGRLIEQYVRGLEIKNDALERFN